VCSTPSNTKDSSCHCVQHALQHYRLYHPLCAARPPTLSPLPPTVRNTHSHTITFTCHCVQHVFQLLPVVAVVVVVVVVVGGGQGAEEGQGGVVLWVLSMCWDGCEHCVRMCTVYVCVLSACWVACEHSVRLCTVCTERMLGWV
jgi:hypothetical protein